MNVICVIECNLGEFITKVIGEDICVQNFATHRACYGMVTFPSHPVLSDWLFQMSCLFFSDRIDLKTLTTIRFKNTKISQQEFCHGVVDYVQFIHFIRHPYLSPNEFKLKIYFSASK